MNGKIWQKKIWKIVAGVNHLRNFPIQNCPISRPIQNRRIQWSLALLSSLCPKNSDKTKPRGNGLSGSGFPFFLT